MVTEIKKIAQTQPLPVSGISAKACLAVSRLFLTGSLKRFGFRKEEITRFDTMENRIADRVEQIEEYVQLFRPFSAFEGKTVLDLGCNKGYLLNSFLQKENFTAVGADINAEALEIGRKTFGDKIKFVQRRAQTESVFGQSQMEQVFKSHHDSPFQKNDQKNAISNAAS